MKANRNFGDDATIRGIHNFNPGGDDFGVIRIVDGHEPFEVGEDGRNTHQPSGGDPMWDDPVGVQVEDD